MLTEVLNADYTTPETADALEHGNFGDFRRNLMRDNKTVMPRRNTLGRGQYGYAEILEMAFHMPISSRHTRETAMHFCFALFRYLDRQVANSKEMQDAWPMLNARCDEFDEDKYGMGAMALAPELFFNEKLISRDPKDRTWAVFLPHRIVNTDRGLTLVKANDTKLSDVESIAYRLATDGCSDDRTRYVFGYEALGPGILDLTGIVLRLEDILQFRLDARNVGRRA